VREGSFGNYRETSSVKHPQPLVAFNYNYITSNSTIFDVGMWCGFVCDDFYLFNFMFSFSHASFIDILFLLYLCMIFLMALLK
jgi:hypothetical protein